MIQKKAFPIHEICNDNTLSCYIAKLYTGTQGENNLYHHNGTLENGIDDNSYRYAGASDKVNNYVCFGSDESPCPTDNLYRIIGVIDGKVKLIKYDYATSDLLGTDGDYKAGYRYGDAGYKGSNFENIAAYNWNNATQSNTWSESNLNKINLNTNFLTNIGKSWADKITETAWKVGGNTKENINEVIPSVAYQNETLNPMSNTTDGKTEYNAKIGLMYVSEYGFAASPSAWTTTLNEYNKVKNKNWMYMGLYEWTITRTAGTRTASISDSAFAVAGLDGYVYYSTVISNFNGIRPTFSLYSSITYESGQGTATDPIRIN